MHPPFRLSLVLASLAAAVAATALRGAGNDTFSTLAGFPLVPGLADGTGASARFHGLSGVVADPAGNLYVADTQNNAIREVTPQGVVTTIAGAANGSSGHLDGVGSAARFDAPRGVAMDAAGNLYVADSALGYVRKITLSGGVATVTTLSGTPGACSSVAVDPAGDLVYVVESDLADVLQISVTGNSVAISVIAGVTGQPGYADGAGPFTQFSTPQGIAWAAPGLLYVADSDNGAIRQISIAGGNVTVSTYGPTAFLNPEGVAVDAQGNVLVADTTDGTIQKISPNGGSPTVSARAGISGAASYRDGPAASAVFNAPAGLGVDASGTVYVADTGNNVLRKLAGGVVSSIAGTTSAGSVDGTGAAARFNGPAGVAADAAGNFYVADSANNQIRKVTPAGVVTTIAGVAGLAGEVDGAGATAQFSLPIGIAVDPTGSPIYVADAGGRSVRKIVISGGVATVSTVYALFQSPFGLALDTAGDLFVTDESADQVDEIPHGTTTPIALAGGFFSGFGSDGVGANARFHGPIGIACNPQGTVLYVADQGNFAIRKVAVAGGVGTVTTVGGHLGLTGYQDGPAATSFFGSVWGVALDSSGNLFITEPFFDLVRELDSSGNVSTLGGTLGTRGDVDGVGGTAQFNTPLGIAVDGNGHLAFASDGDNTLRLGTPPNVGPAPPAAKEPSILSTSSPGVVTAGSAAVFSVQASGNPAPTYQWSFNGHPIPGAIGPGYIVFPAEPINTGTYSVVVGNSQGFATSAPLPLVVEYGPTITGFPGNLLVATGGSATFSVNANGVPAPTYTWFLNGSPVPGATGSALVIPHAAAADAGTYQVVVTNVVASVSAIAQLTVAAPPPPPAPVITSSAQLTAYAGVAFSYQTQASNQPISFSLQGSAPPGLGFSSTDGSLVGTPTAPGLYPVTVGASNAGGTGTLAATILVLPGSSARNFSVRATAGLGGQPVIVGFGVAGAATQTLLRAVGPTLSGFGVSGALPDPSLVLDDSHGAALAANAAWGGSATLASAFSAVGAFPLPAASRDSAVLLGLTPGAYTVQCNGLSGDAGVVLVELYDADGAAALGHFANLSGLARSGPGSAALSAGFVLSGPASESVLIRADGPALAGFGVQGALAAPILALMDGGGATIASNAGWGNGPVAGSSAVHASVQPATAAAMNAAGAFPFTPGSADCAFLATLPPGTYSAQIAGANATSGVTLLEVYLLGP